MKVILRWGSTTSKSLCFDSVSVASEDEVSADDDESSEELLAQESISPKANAKIVGKKKYFSFVIEPQYAQGK